jgi:hypothetical protein
VRFKSTIPALEQAKTFHALDREAAVIGDDEDDDDDDDGGECKSRFAHSQRRERMMIEASKELFVKLAQILFTDGRDYIQSYRDIISSRLASPLSPTPCKLM